MIDSFAYGSFSCVATKKYCPYSAQGGFIRGSGNGTTANSNGRGTGGPRGPCPMPSKTLMKTISFVFFFKF